MKPLKKHPKQQRMEDMTTPDGKFIHKSIKGRKLSVTTSGKTMLSPGAKTVYFPSVEDMKIPGSVGKKTEEMRRWDKALEESRRGLEDNRCKSCGVYPGSSHTDRCETLLEIRKRAWKEYKKNDKVTWEGREYLRSINNEHHYWHLLAGLILIGSIVASVYILSHGLVCAPASFEGKTVINCFRK